MDAKRFLDVPMVIEHMDNAGEFLAREMPQVLARDVEQELSGGTLDAIESPIEAIFALWWKAVSYASAPRFALRLHQQAEVQLEFHRYRLDFSVLSEMDRYRRDGEAFGIPMPKIAIELDGHDFHERTREQVNLRNRRDRELQAAGWIVLHFSGAELNRGPLVAVRSTYDAAWTLIRDWHLKVNARKYP